MAGQAAQPGANFQDGILVGYLGNLYNLLQGGFVQQKILSQALFGAQTVLVQQAGDIQVGQAHGMIQTIFSGGGQRKYTVT